ncbi:TadG family pilus assembly protein [Trinickia sp. YCB016]
MTRRNLKSPSVDRARALRQSHRKQRGAVSVLVALSLVMLLSFAALGIDLGYEYAVRNQLQNAADAAALAGAACLLPRTECSNTTSSAPDWTTSVSWATNGVPLNAAADVKLSTGVVQAGYWNQTGSPGTLESQSITPGSNDYPAVEVTINKTGTTNGGPVATYFADLFGIKSVPIAAHAIAVMSGGGTVTPGGLFPVAINQCMYAALTGLWNSATNSPKLATSTAPLGNGQTLPQVVGQPYQLQITSSYHVGTTCEAGQWTTFTTTANDVPTVNGLINNGNTTALSIGQSTYIQPGTKTSIYSTVDACSANDGNGSCGYALFPVVTNITTGQYAPVVGFACLKIDSAVGGSGKYIVVQLSNKFSNCRPATLTGIGPSYGGTTPPLLVQ